MNEKESKIMFNTTKLPIVEFGLEDISQEAQKMTGKLSISGVQPKLSVKLDKKRNLLISVAERGEYILKPQTPTFPNVPENEQCCMDIAQAMKIDTPPHCLLPLKDRSLAFVIRRFDRKGSEKIGQEDFAQILGEGDKYKGSVEQIWKRLKDISSVPGLDIQLFFELVVLNFLIGNGDAHLKNYSVFHDNNYPIRLTPAYDLVCSKLVIPGEEDSALAINGKKNNLSRPDFEKLAEYLRMPEKIRYKKFQGKLDLINEIIRDSKLDQRKKTQFVEIVKERYHRMSF